jgi:hypothetical protein
MQALPPDGPLHRDDRDPEPAWLDEPPTEPPVDRAANRHRAVIPTLVLVAAVLLIVVLIFLL